MRVLVSVDDAASRQPFETLLPQWGYDVVVAPPGVLAGTALAADAVKLVIADAAPAGLELVRAVRANGLAAYVLLVVPRSGKPGLLDGLEAGADDFLGLPLDADELRARLRAAQRILDLQDAVKDAQQAFRFEARHDSLTGVWNRPAVLDLLRHELDRGSREGTPVGIVMADLDHLKDINSRHGHAAGDAVLRESVRRISTLVRSYDAVGRYGGEEFLVVLPGCDAQRALRMAERIRETLGGQAIQAAGAPVPVTASLGVTAGENSAGSRAEAIVAAAEAALTRASAAGGNRTEMAIGSDLRP